MSKAYAPYIAALVLLGSNGCIASLISMNSYEIVLSRCLLGSLTMLAIFLATRKPAQAFTHKKQLLFLCLSGAALAGNWLCMYEGYARVGVSITTLLTYLGPVLVMAVSPFLFKERLQALCVAGFVVVVAGVALVNGFAPEGDLDPLGLGCGFLAAVFYVGLVGFTKSVTDITGIENSLIQTASALVVCFVYLLIKQGPTFGITQADIVPVLILGCVNTGIGVYLYFSGVSKLPAQSVAVCGYLEPLSAVVFSAIFLHEMLSGAQLLGGAMILGGAVFCEMIRNQRVPNDLSP